MKIELEVCPECKKLRLMARISNPDERKREELYYCSWCNKWLVMQDKKELVISVMDN